MSLNQRLDTVKQRINNIWNTKIRNILSFQYLTGARISEVVGKYAVTREDFAVTKFNDVDVALFSLHTAKRRGRIRVIALPINYSTRHLVNLFKDSRKGKVFHRSARNVQQYCKESFGGLNYLIEDYTLNKKTVMEHERDASTHALRHFRVTELTVNYGFDEIDRAIFFGWMIKGMGKRYMFDLWLQWSRYFPKLLKDIT